MEFFKKTTTTYGLTPHSKKKNVVIMGRKTWESLPDKSKPLKDRVNIVITSDPSKVRNSVNESEKSSKNLHIIDNLSNSLDCVSEELGEKSGQVFVIGGAQLFEESLNHPNSNELFLTRIGEEIDCDTFVPNLKDLLKNYQCLEISKAYSENSIPFDFVRYQNKAHIDKDTKANNIFDKKNEELQYIQLVEEILHNGVLKDDRTNVGNLALFGRMMKFDLEHSFPLLTTKNVSWQGVVEELLWFIKGETNSKKLYGFQWRHFGAQYVDHKTDYSGQGVDQLQNIIDEIKRDPNSRKLIMSAWNPSDLPLMGVPPSHAMAHFRVVGEKLNCVQVQSSCDVGLGVPFDIASCALLTCMIADICGLRRGEFVHTMGDVHIYTTHVDMLKKQITRDPRPFPILKIKDKATKSINDYNVEDFELIGYNPYPMLKMSMAV